MGRHCTRYPGRLDGAGRGRPGGSTVIRTATASRRSSTPAPAREFGTVAGLDGLRAVAVLAVMAFHAGLRGASGGLLGVDIFFVLSGFLVTSILLREQQRTGEIRLGRFWVKRARRLLPGLFVLLVGICLYARFAAAGLSPSGIRGNSFATLLYVANWHYIFTGQNYFVRYGALSPLLHTWSLAVEEQFYLIWPLVAWLVLKRWGRSALGWTAAGAAALSAAVCAALYLAGAGTDRLYYGTDTRAQSIMIGSLLAVLLSLPGDRIRSRPGWRRAVGAAGISGAGVLLVCLHSVQGNGPFLYEGGFAVVAVAAAAVVLLAAEAPDHALSRVLGWGPMRYIGRISYGLYLYHWPVFLVLTQPRTGLNGPVLLAARFAATFIAADLSFRLLEQPIRTRSFPHPSLAQGRWMAARLGLVAAPVAVVGGLLAVTASSSGEALAATAVPGPGYTSPAGATATRPERVTLIGDSMALTLGAGLGRGSLAWGVALDNQGSVGCDLDPASTVNIEGSVNRTAQGCPDWRTAWANLVDRTDPDVLLVFLGRWECLTRIYGGKWTTVGHPSFDAHLQAELEDIIRIGSAHGARVVFLTLPYIAETTMQADGSPWDVNRPARTDAFNADVRAAVARHPGTAEVVDLNRILDPNGHYVSKIHGTRVRSFDEEHISVAGGEWLQPYLLPRVAELGSAHYRSRSTLP